VGISLTTVALIMAALLLGCGGGEGPPSPREGCEMYREAWCTADSNCHAASEQADARETCTFAIRLEVDCSKVVQLSANYQQCIDAIRATNCQQYTPQKGIPFPDSCRGVLLQ
jgi:hypothetical protein